jgi:hypothetical protein
MWCHEKMPFDMSRPVGELCDALQKKISVLLCDYHSKGQAMDHWPVQIDVQSFSKQYI